MRHTKTTPFMCSMARTVRMCNVHKRVILMGEGADVVTVHAVNSIENVTVSNNCHGICLEYSSNNNTLENKTALYGCPVIYCGVERLGLKRCNCV